MYYCKMELHVMLSGKGYVLGHLTLTATMRVSEAHLHQAGKPL